jgi:hypothetical protein
VNQNTRTKIILSVAIFLFSIFLKEYSNKRLTPLQISNHVKFLGRPLEKRYEFSSHRFALLHIRTFTLHRRKITENKAPTKIQNLELRISPVRSPAPYHAFRCYRLRRVCKLLEEGNAYRHIQHNHQSTFCLTACRERCSKHHPNVSTLTFTVSNLRNQSNNSSLSYLILGSEFASSKYITLGIFTELIGGF